MQTVPRCLKLNPVPPGCFVWMTIQGELLSKLQQLVVFVYVSELLWISVIKTMETLKSNKWQVAVYDFL